MSCQVTFLGKSALAALDRADKGFFSGVDPVVQCQVPALEKGFSTVREEADESPAQSVHLWAVHQWAFGQQDALWTAVMAARLPGPAACSRYQIGCVCGGRHRARSGYKAVSRKILHGTWCALISGRNPVGQPAAGLSPVLADDHVSGGCLSAFATGLPPDAISPCHVPPVPPGAGRQRLSGGIQVFGPNGSCSACSGYRPV